MPPDRRLLRERNNAIRQMREYQLKAGQWCQWFRFNPTTTTSDPVYSTGPQRTWYPAITIPVLLGEFSRAPQNFDAEGLYLMDRLHFVINYDSFYNSGITDPDPTGMDHLNDRVGFDGHLFGVDSFVPRGRVASFFWTISCDLREVAQADLDEDAAIPMFAQYIVTS